MRGTQSLREEWRRSSVGKEMEEVLGEEGG